jgi:hypothetical protein
MVMVTYDSHLATDEMHAQARTLIEKAGLSFTMAGETGGYFYLPQTTAIGDSTLSAVEVRDRTWNLLAAAGLNPKRVAVAQGGTVAARAAA